MATVEQKFLQMQSELNDFERDIGLDRLDKYYTMKDEVVHSLTAEQCGEIAIDIANISLSVQNVFNEEFLKVNWANTMIDRSIYGSGKVYAGSAANERRMLAIKDSESTIKLETIRCESQVKVDRLNYLTPRIDALSQRFSDLQVTKLNKGK